MTETAASSIGASSPPPGRPSRNAAIAMSGEVVSKITTFAWTVVAARQLSREGFGVLNFALSLGIILGAIAEWGFDPLLVQRASREPDQRERHFSHAIAWEGLVASVLFGAAIIAVAIAAKGTERLVLLLMLIAFFLDVFSDSIRALGVAMQRQGVGSTALVAQRLLTAASVITVLLTGGGLRGLAIAFLGSWILGHLAHQIALRRLRVRVRVQLMEKRGMINFLRSSTNIGVSALVLAALFRIDALMIEAFKGDAALGAYAAAYKLFETSLFVAFAVNGALFPLMSRAGDDGAEVRRILERMIGAVMFFFVPYAVVTGIEAHRLLDIFYGGDYAASSATSLKWLAAAAPLFALAFAFGPPLTAMQRTFGQVVAAIAATVLNISLNLVLIPSIGIKGAAITTTASYIIEASVLLYFVTRVSGGRVRVLENAAPALIASGVLAVMLLVTSMSLAADLSVGGVLYLVTWLIAAGRIAPSQSEFAFGLLRRVLPRSAR